MKAFIVAALLTLGLASAHAADVVVTYKGNGNATAAITTSSADLATIDSPSTFAGRIFRVGAAAKVTVGGGFTNASATAAIWFVRGHFDNGAFRPSGLATSATLTADGTVKINGLFVAPATTFDTAGFDACFVAIGSVSAGSVTLYEACH